MKIKLSVDPKTCNEHNLLMGCSAQAEGEFSFLQRMLLRSVLGEMIESSIVKESGMESFTYFLVMLQPVDIPRVIEKIRAHGFEVEIC